MSAAPIPQKEKPRPMKARGLRRIPEALSVSGLTHRQSTRFKRHLHDRSVIRAFLLSADRRFLGRAPSFRGGPKGLNSQIFRQRSFEEWREADYDSRKRI